jgi:hypothetical protein
MRYKEKFEDDGFVYELRVQPAAACEVDLHTTSQGEGYFCEWTITEKKKKSTNEVAVTNDDCEMIVFHSVEAAVSGARAFLSL